MTNITGVKRVRLNTDLTRYDKRLVVGEEGRVLGFGRNDNFAEVRFDNGLLTEILWKSLDKLDTVRQVDATTQ